MSAANYSVIPDSGEAALDPGSSNKGSGTPACAWVMK